MTLRTNRRRFLGLGSLALTGSALPAAAAVASGEDSNRWDESADVIVVGTGFAGLAAAIEASAAGASVIVVDKMRVPGGNSIINGGYLAAAGTALQARKGIDDSPAKMFDDMTRAGRSLNHPALARRVCEESVAAFNWARNDLGAVFKDKPALLGGHSVARSHRTTENSGSGIIRPMLQWLQDHGVTPRQETTLQSIVLDSSGHARGLVVQPVGGDSTAPRRLRATGGIVLAGGGFGADVAYRSMQDPRLGDSVSHTNREGSDAGALLTAIDAGALALQLSWIQLGPWTSPDEAGMGLGYVFNLESALPYGVLVERASGERIVNELANRKERADAIMATGEPCIAICDARVAGNTPRLELLLTNNIVREFPDLTSLAEAYNIPASTLQETVDKFNDSVDRGTDDAFGKPILADARPIADAPFYAMRTWPKVHHTMGGLNIDREARVIGRNHEPIPGLFAAGEIAGGIHGAVRLGSCAITDCLVFGRVAGRNAVSES